MDDFESLYEGMDELDRIRLEAQQKELAAEYLENSMWAALAFIEENRERWINAGMANERKLNILKTMREWMLEREHYENCSFIASVEADLKSAIQNQTIK